MKKITSILCLLLAFLGVSTAWADQTIPTLSSDGTYHYYAIKNLRHNRYVLWNGNNNLSQSSTNTISGVFYFTEGSTTSTDDGVTIAKIHNIAGQALASFASWNDTGIDWYIKANTQENKVGICIANDANFANSWNDYGNLGTSIGSYKYDDGGSVCEVVELSESDVLALTRTIPSSLTNRIGYSAFYTLDAYNTLTTALSNATSVEGITTAVSTYLNSSPTVLEVTEGSFLLLNKEHNRYVCAKSNGTDSYLGCSETANSFNNVFTFKKVEEGKYKIYNEYTDKYVGYVLSSNNRNSEFSLTDEANARTFTIENNTTTGYITFKDETITDQIDNKTCNAWHVSKNNTNGGYGVIRWVTSAGASMFDFVSSESLENSLYTALENQEVNRNFGTAIGTYATSDAYTTAKSNFTATKSISNYKTLETAAAALTYNTPDASKYYTIKNAKTQTYYLTEDYANNSQLGLTKGTNIVPSLWKFEACTTEGKTDLYYIQAANSQNYMSKTVYDYTMKVVAKDNSEVGLYDLCNHDHVAVTGSATLVCYANDARSDRGTANVEGTAVKSWNAKNEGANNWYIEAVDEIPVTISSVGYATLNLPMSVNIPSGVEAYYGASEGDGQINLTALNGVIPAETPVILVGTEGEHSFTIAYDDNTAKPATNALSGTLVPSTVGDGASAYVLKNGTSGIGMYKVTSDTDRTIAENKAYAGSLVAETSGAAQLSFNFGNVTGINAATVNGTGNSTIYDLNGRRVLYPTHGVFVKANGQKVYIK